MGSFAQYLQPLVLDHLFSKATYTAPATLHVALYTDVVDSAGVGTEVAGGSYARKAVTNNATNFPAATGSDPATKANGVAVTFVTATGDWGTIQSFGIWDDPTAGNLIAFGLVTPNQAIPNGVTASFNIGALTITLQ